jgi:hypothetical protein
MKNVSSFMVKVSRSIKEINQEEWNSISPPILESYNFFKTIDETLFQQFKLYYISLYEGLRILCIAPCFVMDYPLDSTIQGPPKKLISWVRNIIPNLFTSRVLICGCPAAEGRIGIRDFNRREITNLLVKEMRSIAKKENAHLLAFKEFSKHYAKILEPLLKMGFHKVQSYPSVELDIHFKSFEEYLASLSRATRKDLKRKFKKINGKVKIKMEVKGDLGEILDEAYDLYLNTFEKSEVTFEKITKDFFKNISRNMPEETKYFLWWLGERLVAFDLCLVSKDLLIDEYIGMDYDVAYKYRLYFLTFRDIIKWCIKNGIRRYESGPLNFDPKKRLDFRFIPQYIYVKHNNSIINILFGLLTIFLKPENFDPVLKSMKEKARDGKS